MTRPTMITWTSSDPTVSQFNEQIRDAMNWNYDQWDDAVRYVAADESNSTTTLADSTYLTWDVAANDVWEFVLTLIYTGSTTADFQFWWTYPTGTTLLMGSDVVAPGTGSTLTTLTEASGARSIGAAGASTPTLVKYHGVFFVSSTSGTITLQFAQAASGATAAVVKKGSNLILKKLSPYP